MSRITCLGCFSESSISEWKKNLKARSSTDSMIYRFVTSLEHIHTKIDKSCVDQIYSAVGKFVAKKTSETQLWNKIFALEDNKGHSLLHQFAIRGDLSAVSMMLELGDILKRKSDSNKTAQEYYKENCHRNLKKDLLHHHMKQMGLDFKHSLKCGNATYRFTDICYSNGFHSHKVPFALFEVEVNGKSYVRFCWLSGSANCVVDVTDRDPDESTRYGANSFQVDDYSETEMAESVSTESRMCRDSLNPPRRPEDNQFKSSKKIPDFAHPQMRTTLAGNDPYGDLLATVYLSQDKKVRYLILEESDGAAFIATAECVKKAVTKYGIRQKSPALGGLDFPLYEYESQCSEEFWSKHKYGPYRRTSKYLERVPALIAYRHAREKEKWSRRGL